MIQALILGFGLLGIQGVSEPTYNFFCQIIQEIDFKTILLEVLLSFLLFAGAMHVNIEDLRQERWAVLLFSTLGVLISTALVGILFYGVSMLFGLGIPLLHCFIFGALISPTDPIAVISILKAANVSKSLELKIEGESLFNDGVGVVVFLSLVGIASSQNHNFELESIGELFILEAGGGILYGFILGWLGTKMLFSVQDDPKICLLITLAIAMGGYALADIIHVSGPLAMVVAGLYIGNQIMRSSFIDRARDTIELFWELLDDTLNAVLFVLIGLVIHSIDFNMPLILAGLLTIPVVLICRAVSVGIPYAFLKHKEHSPWKTVAILTWGGLRGGISVALALSLDESLSKMPIVVITYVVVVFSILVQGLSIGTLVKRLKI